MASITKEEGFLSNNELNSSSLHRQNETCSDRYESGVSNADLTAATEYSFLIAIIVNSIACPFTVLLNVLIIAAVVKTRRLRNNSNILLAFLAATDVLSGLFVQPSYVIWKALQLNSVKNNCLLRTIHNWIFIVIPFVSLFHLTLVTLERLIAIKFSLRYLSILTPRKIRILVATVWVFALVTPIGLDLASGTRVSRFSNVFLAFIVVFCILFILATYAVLFREIRRHREAIQTQQRSHEEMERFARDKKTFKTIVFVFAALLISYVPMAIALLFRPRSGYSGIYDVLLPWARTFAMLNSLFNPLIYCWRQKELRNAVLRNPVVPSPS